MTDAPAWIRLCEMSELPPAGARGFKLSGQDADDLFVVRRGDLLRAYRNSCPHQPGASLPWRRHGYLDAAGEHIVCHGHGALFTLDGGTCVLGPCLGQTLEPIELRVEEGLYLSALFAPIPLGATNPESRA